MIGDKASRKPITARRTGLPERAWRWCRREPALASVTAALALVLVSGLLSVTGLWLRADRLRQVAEAYGDVLVPQPQRGGNGSQAEPVFRDVWLSDR